MDQLLGLLLFGLGIRTQPLMNVLGEETEVSTTTAEEGSQGDSELLGSLETGEELTDNTSKSSGEEANHESERTEAGRRKTSEEIQKARTLFKENIAASRVRAKESFKEKRDVFTKRLSTIRDEKKKTILRAVDTRLSEVNTKRTGAMSSHVDKMSEILSKVTERAATAAGGGQDTTSVDSAVATANAAIDTAKAAVSAQAAKEYVVSISSETKLKSDVNTTQTQIEADLKSVHATIVTARKAVSEALRTLAAVAGEFAPPPLSE